MSSSSLRGEPASKKAKTASQSATNPMGLQTNLFAFFASSAQVPPKKKRLANAKENEKNNATKITDNSKQGVQKPGNPTKTTTLVPLFGGSKSASKPTTDEHESEPTSSTQPIIPKQVSTPRNAMWQSIHDQHVLIRRPIPKEPPRSKVAALDFDGTLMVWNSPSWPNQLAHYELWNSEVIHKLRTLHDQGHKLVLISNQGAVQKAHNGKKATLVKTVMDWIALQVNRPVHAVLSTRSPKKAGEDSFHKPSPKMWKVAVQYFNQGEPFDIASSFFVGDSADPNDEQGGVDAKFSKAVGTTYYCNGESLPFYTPQDYFGPSSKDQRQQERRVAMSTQAPAPLVALQTRAALLGGYFKTQILLILCGVQGSGKSTFCQHLLEGMTNTQWVHVSQDTINAGKPGPREKVEAAALEALQNGASVVVDRMHLDATQRSFFVAVAEQAGVPAHVVVLNPPKEVVAQRVRARTDHPGRVQGPEGARRAVQALEQLQLPTYKEDLQLISCANTGTRAIRLAQVYRATVISDALPPPLPRTVELLDQGPRMPRVILGTMGIGKRIAVETMSMAVSSGIAAIDTAPTYKNEDKIGEALQETSKDIFCIGKVPKVVVEPQQLSMELNKTLQNLQRSNLDLLLLHWPCDVIAAGSLDSVWKEMEDCYDQGKCKALGVCNFNIEALSQLLSKCRIPPTVNQVERHPLLRQMDLLDFCQRNNIELQAHTPLGQGKEDLLSHDAVRKVASESSMTPAQVAIQWNLQQGVSVVPKSKTKKHILEVQSTRELSSPHMKELDSIGTRKRFVAPPFMYGVASYCWDEQMPRK